MARRVKTAGHIATRNLEGGGVNKFTLRAGGSLSLLEVAIRLSGCGL
jgi:hypothetical protein